MLFVRFRANRSNSSSHCTAFISHSMQLHALNLRHGPCQLALLRNFASLNLLELTFSEPNTFCAKQKLTTPIITKTTQPTSPLRLTNVSRRSPHRYRLLLSRHLLSPSRTLSFLLNLHLLCTLLHPPSALPLRAIKMNPASRSNPSHSASRRRCPFLSNFR